MPDALPRDPLEPRLCIRFVCTLATGTGVVVWDRRAAAAAAFDRLAWDARCARKACEAAVVAAAEVLVVDGRGFRCDSV